MINTYFAFVALHSSVMGPRKSMSIMANGLNWMMCQIVMLGFLGLLNWHISQVWQYFLTSELWCDQNHYPWSLWSVSGLKKCLCLLCTHLRIPPTLFGNTHFAVSPPRSRCTKYLPAILYFRAVCLIAHFSVCPQSFNAFSLSSNSKIIQLYHLKSWYNLWLWASCLNSSFGGSIGCLLGGSVG